MNNSFEDKIGLIIKSTTSSAKTIAIIRKYNPISIAEIKKAIDEKNFIFYCDYSNISGVRKVRRCYDELTKSGAVVEIYEDGILSTREIISNLINTCREIEIETQAIIDAEIAAEGGDED